MGKGEMGGNGPPRKRGLDTPTQILSWKNAGEETHFH
jgi:hypothetical protein